MSALVKVLGRYAPGHVLEHDDKEFVFARIGQATKAALTVDYFRRAREAVYALRGEVPADEYDRQLKAVLDSYRRGEYAFPEGEAYRWYMGDGLPSLIARLTGRTEAEALALMEARGVETYHVCLCVVYDSMGEFVKKKMLSVLDTPQTVQLLEVLCPPPNSNGSSCSTITTPPASPAPASASGTSPT